MQTIITVFNPLKKLHNRI